MCFYSYSIRWSSIYKPFCLSKTGTGAGYGQSSTICVTIIIPALTVDLHNFLLIVCDVKNVVTLLIDRSLNDPMIGVEGKMHERQGT